MRFKETIDKVFGPPTQGLQTLRELTSSETSQRLDKLLARVERISKNSSNIPEVLELLKLIQVMDNNGTLDKLNQLLSSLPKGKQGQALVIELRKAIAELAPRLDKLSNLAQVLMEKEE